MIGKLALKLIGPLLKLIFPKLEDKFSKMRQEIIEHIFKVGKLEENTRYRELPNEADRGVLKLQDEMNMVKDQLKGIIKDVHPPAIDLKEWDEVKDTIKKVKNMKKFKIG